MESRAMLAAASLGCSRAAKKGTCIKKEMSLGISDS